MHKNRLIWLILLTLVLFIIIFFVRHTSRNVMLINGQIVKVDIANTALKRAGGLMYREHLSEHSGMLFIFDQQAKHIFWMKNTLIPLDMIWIDKNFKIVDITRKAQPCKTQSCQTYMPASPAKYVLEVNGGYAEGQNIKIGDTVKLE